MAKDNRSRNWVIVFYPESAPADFEQIIRDWHIKCFLSPLHESDINPDGTQKKPHYHLLLMFSGKKSVDQVQEFSDELSGVKVLEHECAVRDCKAVARYLIHLDNPEKFQYERSTVKSFGGADYMEYIETSSDVSQMLSDITEFCCENHVVALAALQWYCLQQRPDWFRVVATHTIYISSMLRSIYWCEQNGRTEVLIKSTGEFYELPDSPYMVKKNVEKSLKKVLTCDNNCDNI